MGTKTLRELLGRERDLARALTRNYRDGGSVLAAADRRSPLELKDLATCLSALGSFNVLHDKDVAADMERKVAEQLARTWRPATLVGVSAVLQGYMRYSVTPHSLLADKAFHTRDSISQTAFSHQCQLLHVLVKHYLKGAPLPLFFPCLCTQLYWKVSDAKAKAEASTEKQNVMTAAVRGLFIAASQCLAALRDRRSAKLSSATAQHSATEQSLKRLRHSSMWFFVLCRAEYKPSDWVQVLRYMTPEDGSAVETLLRTTEGTTEPVLAVQLLRTLPQLRRKPSEELLESVANGLATVAECGEQGVVQKYVADALEGAVGLAEENLVPRAFLTGLVQSVERHVETGAVRLVDFDSDSLVSVVRSHVRVRKITGGTDGRRVCVDVMKEVGRPSQAMSLEPKAMAHLLASFSALRFDRSRCPSSGAAAPQLSRASFAVFQTLTSVLSSSAFVGRCDAKSAAMIASSVVTGQVLGKRFLKQLYAQRIAEHTEAGFLFNADAKSRDEIAILWALVKGSVMTTPLSPKVSTLLTNTAKKAISTQCPGNYFPQLLWVFSSLRCAERGVLGNVGHYLSRHVGLADMPSSHLAMSCRAFASIGGLFLMPFWKEAAARVIADGASSIQYNADATCQLLYALSRVATLDCKQELVAALQKQIRPGAGALSPKQVVGALRSFARLRAKPLLTPALTARLLAVAQEVSEQEKQSTRAFLEKHGVPIPSALQERRNHPY
eukprot:Rhum_TRINITY_DN3752_c0_g2::Rhum_TRINITY_DN3752_c0_g2_i1::g.11944::m.11944